MNLQKYTKEFKEKIISEVNEDTSMLRVAKKYNIPYTTITGWINKNKKVTEVAEINVIEEKTKTYEYNLGVIKENELLKKMLIEKELEIYMFKNKAS